MSPFLLLAADTRYEASGWEAIAARPDWLVGILLLAAVAVVVAIGSAWYERHALPPRRWRLLALLRLLAIGAVAFLMAGWQRRPVTEQTEPSRVVLLVDASLSMRLPSGMEDPGNAVRSDVASHVVARLAQDFSAQHQVEQARFGTTVVYRDPASENPSKPTEEPEVPFYQPRDTQTRLGDALEQVLEDHRAMPLAAVVLLTDGRTTTGSDPQRIAERFAEHGVPIHAVGFGPLVEPERVRLVGLSAPSRPKADDPLEVTVRAAASGGFAGSLAVELLLEELEPDKATAPSESLTAKGRVVATERLELSVEKPIVAHRFELAAPPAGSYRLAARLVEYPEEPLVATRFESIDRPTRVLLLASGPVRDYRFLRDQLHRDDSFEVDVCLQAASLGVSQDASSVLEHFPDDLETLDTYDAIVAFDADWDDVGEVAQGVLRDWVVRRGGGLLIIAGAVHTRQLVAQRHDRPLTALLPVRFQDDPLTLAIDRTAQTASRSIRLTLAGSGADFMRIDPKETELEVSWLMVNGFYARAPDAEAKLGATTYAFLARTAGGASTESRPLLVEQFYGAGRVAYLATAETWRLRRVHPAWFTTFHTRLLRHLSQGRVLGATAQGTLFCDRDSYQVGQTITARLTLPTPAMPNDRLATPPMARWRLPGGELLSQPMESIEGQPDSFRSSLAADTEGEHQLRVTLPGFDSPLTTSATVTLPPLETRATTRNESLLQQLTSTTGGMYCATIDAAPSIVEPTASRAEVRPRLGPPDTKFTAWAAHAALLVTTLLLTIEWALRRLWRLA